MINNYVLNLNIFAQWDPNKELLKTEEQEFVKKPLEENNIIINNKAILLLTDSLNILNCEATKAKEIFRKGLEGDFCMHEANMQKLKNAVDVWERIQTNISTLLKNLQITENQSSPFLKMKNAIHSPFINPIKKLKETINKIKQADWILKNIKESIQIDLTENLVCSLTQYSLQVDGIEENHSYYHFYKPLKAESRDINNQGFIGSVHFTMATQARKWTDSKNYIVSDTKYSHDSKFPKNYMDVSLTETFKTKDYKSRMTQLIEKVVHENRITQVGHWSDVELGNVF